MKRSHSALWRRLFALAAAGVAVYLGALAFVALQARPRPSQMAVVFGNAISQDGTPAPRLRARLDAALALYRAGLVPRILVSGGIERNGADEADAMGAYLAAHGVQPRAILRDPLGATTYDTARNTAALLPAGSVIVVTQWFHVPRAELAMHRFGLSQVSAAYPDYFEVRDVYSFLREAVALPFYAIRPISLVRGDHAEHATAAHSPAF